MSEIKGLMGYKSHFRNILFHSLEKFIFTFLNHTIKFTIMPSEESSTLKLNSFIKHCIACINNNDNKF